LLVAYDAQYPQPLFASGRFGGVWVGFVLAPVAAPRPVGAVASARRRHARAAVGNASLGRLTLSFSDSPADRMDDAALESLRASIPAARSLPLLYQLAVRKAAVVNIDYLDGRCVAVEVDPCA